ncbi:MULTISPECIES: Gfo/Idh/MocA family protein [Paenibacillus]|uniref:Oxidoreductase domain protein n=2 Tax=Paenibacillus lactis TaxID=228574 RepID=G4HN05_9BACL|nr:MULTISPECIES: Gfo/Idh/MocA family oxidoreductase [Paenibacillus]EHB54370.1 oxidoreductase domain protein [Paenibacillus lactis 154]MBP1891627.1 putative dehydrogenase [Paenibacillus lactis]GIO88870.1 oxidoreductase [Paenibacillus lactis]HAG00370.1 gfo/Idh/MocA family oxidoreductase [Paenibacillus lactis]
MLKVAIIGTGAISPSHIEAYLQFEDRCKIVALCDLYPEKAEARREQYGLDAKIVQDYKELLKDGIDLVSICMPPYVHAQVTVDFLNAGSHVVVEKPMAASLKECDDMIEAAQNSGKLLSVIAQNRFRNPIMKLKHILDSGMAGKILHAQVDSFWWRGHCYYDLWWRGTWEKEGGGPTLNHAVHHIDGLLWMLGRPSQIQAYMSNVAHDNAEVEDLSIAMMKYPNGALGQLTSSVVHHGEEQQYVFQGQFARISAPWRVTASISLPNGFPERDLKLEEKIQKYYDELPDLPYEGHTGQIDNMLSAIEHGTPVLIDGESGRSTLELIMSIYKSASTGENVQLPLRKDDPFYTQDGVKGNVPYFYEKGKSVENFTEMKITTGSNYGAQKDHVGGISQ